MEEIGAYLDVTPRDFKEIYAHAYKIAGEAALVHYGGRHHACPGAVRRRGAVRAGSGHLPRRSPHFRRARRGRGRTPFRVVSEADVVRFVGGGETVTVMPPDAHADAAGVRQRRGP